MAMESCPKCGTEKHQLNACQNCGFRRKIFFNRTGSTKENTSNKLKNKNSNINNSEKQRKAPHQKIYKGQPTKITKKHASEVLQAFKEQEESSDIEIKKYIQLNPVNDGVGPLGKPQDKYRWGFYGSKSMDYDGWSKNK